MLEGQTRRMSASVIQLLKDEAKNESLLVSDISFWEVANKSAKGKLTLSIDAVIWLDKAGGAPGVTYLPVDRSALIQSTRLRGEAPGDPVDRILLATAQLNAASLVTCDAQIIDYARRERGVSVRDARK
jgi:PIN domain nuclease of toxin-antitoxin system